jgi:hypothetical protein
MGEVSRWIKAFSALIAKLMLASASHMIATSFLANHMEARWATFGLFIFSELFDLLVHCIALLLLRIVLAAAQTTPLCFTDFTLTMSYALVWEAEAGAVHCRTMPCFGISMLPGQAPKHFLLSSWKHGAHNIWLKGHIFVLRANQTQWAANLAVLRCCCPERFSGTLLTHFA